MRIRSIVVSLVVLGAVGIPGAAQAGVGTSVLPASANPACAATQCFGPVDVEAVTDDAQAGGLCAVSGYAAYAIDLDGPSVNEAAKLELMISEQDAGALCGYGVYDDGLTDPFQIDRADHALIEETCAASCPVSLRLEPGSYTLLVWSNGADPGTLDLIGSLRGFSRVSGSLSGLAIPSCKRIERGETSTFSFDVSPTPPEASRFVRVRVLDRRTGDEISDVVRPLNADGEGTFVIQNLERGYHRVIAFFNGSAVATPARLERCLAVRGPTKPVLKAVEANDYYDDYAVWNDGDVMTFRMSILPWPPKTDGKVNVRIERNLPGHRYYPWNVLEDVRVEDSVTILKLRAHYRPNGLPFYRMRLEWQGSPTHAPAKGPWICFQVNP